jgi:hypothetical protein
MKNKWWEHLGKVAGGLFMVALIQFNSSKSSSFTEYFAMGIAGIAVILTVIYFVMKQNSDEAF